MREILFRGQTRRKGEYIVNMAGDKCESHWVYGGIFPQNKDGDFAIIYQQEPEIRKFSVYADTVGQYTGLTDKNGVKIFEGDIVKTHYENAQKSEYIEQVVFHNGKFCAYFSNQLCKQWANLYDGTEHLPQDKSVYMDSVEVIGNIHDNPELLETASKPAAKNIAQSGVAPATENFELMEVLQ